MTEKRLPVRWLTDLQFDVTQNAATEPPFSGRYYRHDAPGVYRCVVCDALLFSSASKFHSPCGWPAFSAEISQGAVTLREDLSHGMVRTEARCASCGAHLGHLFDDGPTETHLRYCVNSASLVFEGPSDTEE